MTPIMILLFNVAPLTAVSTDLVVSLVIKPIGRDVIFRRGTVNKGLVGWVTLVGTVGLRRRPAATSAGWGQCALPASPTGSLPRTVCQTRRWRTPEIRERSPQSRPMWHCQVGDQPLPRVIGGKQALRRVLVTGAAGFIGAKVTENLVAGGDSVVGLDNLNDAYDVRLKHWRLARLQRLKGFSFVAGDVCDRDSVDSTVAGESFDAIINLAARAGVRPSVEDPWAYFETNATGTLNLLEAARRNGVGKFVLASTSSLYGSHNPLPYAEDADTNRPLSPYSASKKAAEALAFAAHHLHGIDVTVLRYFTVYGPAGRPDMSLFRFVQWVAEGHPVLIYGDGSQTRDFTYVDDIAAGTVAALRPLGFEVINLGSDQPVVLADVLTYVEELVGKQANVVNRPFHKADVHATWASIGQARTLLGWEPTTPWRDGVANLVGWYHEERDWARNVETGS